VRKYRNGNDILARKLTFFLQQEVFPGNQFRDNPRLRETPRVNPTAFVRAICHFVEAMTDHDVSLFEAYCIF
jgi:hypothetical protein